MNLLFTGGCGYVGSHCALAFLENFDCQITILDNLSTGFIENYNFLKKKYKDKINFINDDIKNIHSLNIEPSFVLHFAASLSVFESILNPILYYQNNTAKSIELISFCSKHNINIIFSSTAAVYGEQKKQSPIREHENKIPINPYGKSKLMIENVIQDSIKNYVILRYFNVAGAYMKNDYKNSLAIGQRSENATHLVKVAAQCAVNKKNGMKIFGIDYDTRDGSCIRDYIHIDDLANAHVESLKYIKQDKSNIFNVGYSKGFSVKEIIECMKKISKNDFNVNIGERRSGDPAYLVADNHNLISNTGWKPKFDDIETIIKSSYEWEKYLK